MVADYLPKGFIVAPFALEVHTCASSQCYFMSVARLFITLTPLLILLRAPQAGLKQPKMVTPTVCEYIFDILLLRLSLTLPLFPSASVKNTEEPE